MSITKTREVFSLPNVHYASFFDYVYKLMAYLLLFIAVRGGHGMP